MSEDPEPTTGSASAELIRRAREAQTASGPFTGASGKMIRSARTWLEEGEPPPGDAEDSAPYRSGSIEFYRERLDREEQVSLPVTPGRIRSEVGRLRTPIGVSSRRPPARRALVGLVAVAVLAGALIANLSARFAAEHDLQTSTTTPGIYEVTEPSEGSISSPWTDPCSNATITGRLAAEVTYRESGGEASVSISITGVGLEGSDGIRYEFGVTGSATGAPGQEVFTFAADVVSLARQDGAVFSAPTQITVEITDRRPDNWQFSMDPFVCEAP